MKYKRFLLVAGFVLALAVVGCSVFAPTATPTSTPPPCEPPEGWKGFGAFAALEVPTTGGVVEGSVQIFPDRASGVFLFEESQLVFSPCIEQGLTIQGTTLEAFVSLEGKIFLSPETAELVVTPSP